MESGVEIEVRDFPAFIIVDDKGNDSFAKARARCFSIGSHPLNRWYGPRKAPMTGLVSPGVTTSSTPSAGCHGRVVRARDRLLLI